MKILIIGADGQLGTELVKVIPAQERIAVTVKELDITDKEKTLSCLKKIKPSIVINTAAYNLVDQAEDSVELAFQVNAVGAANVALACRELEAALVHLSTDYVFDGTKRSPYLESDAPNPLSVYGTAKLAGELCVRNILAKYFIVRTSGLFGVAGCLGKGGGNFIEKIIEKAKTQSELRVVFDETFSPTYALDLAGKIYELALTRNYGLYHIVNHGECSWHELAAKIFELIGKKIKIHAVPAAEIKAKAKRPVFSVLNNAKLAELGLDDLRPWPEALKAYLIEKGHL